MADLKPVYLISGEDNARIDDWRARLRRRAEGELGPGGLELFDPKADSPDDVAAALATLTFGEEDRYLLADDVAEWKASDLAPLIKALDPVTYPEATILVLIARGKAPKELEKAVAKLEGEVRSYEAPKPWKMAPWAVAHAKTLGLKLDNDAARLLIDTVGPSEKRLARELEKLAIAIHPETRATVEEVEAIAAGDAPPKVFDLADAVVAGDLRAAIALAEELRSAGEDVPALMWPIVNRMREAHAVVSLLESGVSEKDLGRHIKGPPWKLKKAVAAARKLDRETLERGLCALADLEFDVRGGSDLGQDTAFTLTLARVAA